MNAKNERRDGAISLIFNADRNIDDIAAAEAPMQDTKQVGQSWTEREGQGRKSRGYQRQRKTEFLLFFAIPAARGARNSPHSGVVVVVVVGDGRSRD